MDDSNLENVLKFVWNEVDCKKVKLYMDNLYFGEFCEVFDFYFGGDEGFVEVIEMLEKVIELFIKSLK